MLPLKVALPFSAMGNSSGPRTTSMKGSQSATLEVETERWTADEAESLPEAWIREVGVARVNCGRSKVSLEAWYTPLACPLTDSSGDTGCEGGATSRAKWTSASRGVPSQRVSRVPEPEPAGWIRPSS